MGEYSKGPEGVEINKGISNKDTKGVYLDRRLEGREKQARADGLGFSVGVDKIIPRSETSQVCSIERGLCVCVCGGGVLEKARSLV